MLRSSACLNAGFDRMRAPNIASSGHALREQWLTPTSPCFSLIATSSSDSSLSSGTCSLTRHTMVCSSSRDIEPFRRVTSLSLPLIAVIAPVVKWCLLLSHCGRIAVIVFPADSVLFGLWNSSSAVPTPPFHRKLSQGSCKGSVDRR